MPDKTAGQIQETKSGQATLRLDAMRKGVYDASVSKAVLTASLCNPQSAINPRVCPVYSGYRRLPHVNTGGSTPILTGKPLKQDKHTTH